MIQILRSWLDVLEGVAKEAQTRFGSLGPLTADEVAALIGMSFLGGEAVMLLGNQGWTTTVRTALRSIGKLIEAAEQSG